jgi:hypothetical protein
VKGICNCNGKPSVLRISGILASPWGKLEAGSRAGSRQWTCGYRDQRYRSVLPKHSTSRMAHMELWDVMPALLRGRLAFVCFNIFLFLSLV